MEIVKKTKDFRIVKKKSGRYGVLNKSKKWINGDDKTTILLGEGLIKVTAPSAKEEAPAQES